MSYIAKALMITQGTLTTNISKLVQKGYVVKYKDEYDKRLPVYVQYTSFKINNMNITAQSIYKIRLKKWCRGRESNPRRD
mgnify:CR=1 FL=1